MKRTCQTLNSSKWLEIGKNKNYKSRHFSCFCLLVLLAVQITQLVYRNRNKSYDSFSCWRNRMFFFSINVFSLQRNCKMPPIRSLKCIFWNSSIKCHVSARSVCVVKNDVTSSVRDVKNWWRHKVLEEKTWALGRQVDWKLSKRAKSITHHTYLFH